MVGVSRFRVRSLGLEVAPGLPKLKLLEVHADHWNRNAAVGTVGIAVPLVLCDFPRV